MSIRVGILNFQAIGQAKLQFDPGVTVITGATGSGKTAILRALVALVSNNPYAKDKIKHGKTETSVAVLVDGFKRVDWRRTATSSAYILSEVKSAENPTPAGPETFSKTGRTRLHQVYPEFPMLWDDSLKRVINFHTEWDLLFPFDRTPAQLFELFEDLINIDDSRAILGRMKDEEGEAKAKEHEFLLRSTQLGEKAAAIRALRDSVSESELDRLRLDLSRVQRELTKLGESLEEGGQLFRAVAHMGALEKKEIDFGEVEKAGVLKRDRELAQDLSQRIGILEGLREFKEDLKVWDVVGGLEEDFHCARRAFALLENTEGVKNCNVSWVMVEEEEKLERGLEEARRLVRYLELAKLVTACSIDLSPLGVGDQVGKDLAEAERIEQELERIRGHEAAYKVEEAQLREEEKKFKVCPLCGSNLEECSHDRR